ncbi:MAG: PAS domain S-box protein [Planctomycetota bacterium]
MNSNTKPPPVESRSTLAAWLRRASESSQPVRLFVAFVAVMAAWCGRVSLIPLTGDQVPFLFYVIAVIASAWYGGLFSGLFATALSILVGTCLDSHMPLFLGPQRFFWFLVFTVVGVSISWAFESSHAARRRAEAALACQLIEVTERKQAERRFRKLFEGVRDHSIVMLDPSGNVTMWNEGAKNLFGYEASEILGHSHVELFGADDRETGTPRRELDEAIAKGSASLEGWRVRRDRSRFWGYSSVTALYDEGKLEGFVKISRDVTDRKKSDESLILSRNSLMSLVNSAMDGIITIDDEQRIVLFNPAAETMFGERADEVVGQRIERLIPARYRPTHESHVKRFGETGVTNRQMGDLGAVSGLRADGTEFPMEASISQMTIRGRQQFTVIIRDVSQRKKTEAELKIAFAELQRSNGELEQFAYVASHDLQEPLRAVSGCVQVLQRRYKDKLDSYAEELIGHTVAGAVRMQTLIEDLLAYSRLATRGKEFAPTDCREIVKRALANLDVAIKESGAVIDIDELPTVRGDATQLTQLFQNLISNAMKFRGDAPPAIEVRARRDGAAWLFSVNDRGIGIASEYFDRIFVIFQRLHMRTDYPGTGIGLSVCKKIVERHGGRIWVESEPGKGSTFFFTLSDQGGHA